MGGVLRAQAEALGWTQNPQELFGCCTEPTAPAAETPRTQSQWEPPLPPASHTPLQLSRNHRIRYLPNVSFSRPRQKAGFSSQGICRFLVWSLPGFPEAGTKGEELRVRSQPVPPAAQSLLEIFKAREKMSLSQGTTPGSFVPSAGGQCQTAT